MADQDVSLPRRSVLASTVAALAGTAFAGAGGAESTLEERRSTDDGTIPPLEFFFGNPLLDEDREPLTDESMVAVEAEPTATVADAPERWKAGQYTKGYEGDGVWTGYPEDAPVPLVAVDDGSYDGTVVGVGSLLVPDGTQWDSGNAQFALNLWDEFVRQTPQTETVLFHQYSNLGPGTNTNHQYWSLDKFDQFRAYAESNGYEIVTDSYAEGETAPTAAGVDVRPEVDAAAGSTFVAALETEQPSAVWLSCPDAFERPELVALRDYLSRGGVVFLHDSSDPVAEEWNRTSGRADGRADDRGGSREAEPDPTTHLNEIADALGIDFRFNDAIVRDPEHDLGNGMGRNVVTTTRFDTDRYPGLFEAREGIAPNGEFYHLRGTAGYPADGDTYPLHLDTWLVRTDGNWNFKTNREEGHQIETRLLGIDTPEDGVSAFERPVEWEGLGDDIQSVPLIKKLQFDDTCSLVSPAGGPLADDDVVAVRAAETATNAAGDAALDYADAAIPLVAAGDAVVGVGSAFVNDGADNPDRQSGTPSYEFLRNVWDDYLGGGATVLYDESHGQPLALDDHSGFVDADGKSVYTVESTSDLVADLPDADAVWLTPPETAFTEAERDALASFVDEGGVVFLHGRAEATGEAYTDNLNRVAAAVDAPFRFNRDSVTDAESNGGAERKPQTTRFGDRNRFPWFLLRQNAPSGGYGGSDSSYATPTIESYSDEPFFYISDNYQSRDIVFEFDPDGTLFGGLGRIYGHTYLAENYPDGLSLEEELIDRGWARVYDSGHSTHDSFLERELDARVNDVGIWSESDPARSEQVRNRPVERLYFPQAASVRTADGPLDDDRVPVRAEPTATDSEAPLVGLDRDANVAMVGSPLLAESYEMRENDYRALGFVDIDPFWVNTAGYENFAFVANLLDALADRDDGSVLIDCGHGQFGGGVDRFGGNYTLSPEDARYFERFLEGVGVNCEGIHDVGKNLLDGPVDARALVISTPEWAFTDQEIDAVREFRQRGGAVLFVGSGAAPDEGVRLLNETAAAVGTDLRVNGDAVRDERHNLHGLARLPTTTNTNPDVDEELFTPTEAEAWSGPGDGLPEEDDGDDEDGDGNGEQKPAMTASGTRSDDGAVFTRGQTNQVDVTIESFAAPAEAVRVTDSVPEGWEVQPYGDAQNTGDVPAVDLGVVSREELENAKSQEGSGGVTRTYFVEATGPTGRYTFGPATATAVNGEPVDPDSAEFGGTDTNTIVGIGQNAIGAGAWDGETDAD